MSNEKNSMNECPEMDYFMDESKSDVVFVIDGQRLPALKQFLSVRNRVFRTMFSEKFKESKDKELEIKDTTFEAFKALIQFLYCNQLVLKDEINLELIEELLKLSDRYEVPTLLNVIDYYLNMMCEKIMSSNDSTEEQWLKLKPISKIAFDYKMKKLSTNLKN